MLSALQIIDTILPLTREDNRCGFKKAKKLRARAGLVLLINDYKNGQPVTLPAEVLTLLHGN